MQDDNTCALGETPAYLFNRFARYLKVFRDRTSEVACRASTASNSFAVPPTENFSPDFGVVSQRLRIAPSTAVAASAEADPITLLKPAASVWSIGTGVPS
jgi:hypothetical protein